jgi:hypothetical protein
MNDTKEFWRLKYEAAERELNLCNRKVQSRDELISAEMMKNKKLDDDKTVLGWACVFMFVVVVILIMLIG